MTLITMCRLYYLSTTGQIGLVVEYWSDTAKVAIRVSNSGSIPTISTDFALTRVLDSTKTARSGA